MIQFLLNQRLITTNKPASTTLLVFIRYDENLRSTKIGCREADCGTCTVLIGSLKNRKIEYRSVTSCLTPLPNVHAIGAYFAIRSVVKAFNPNVKLTVNAPYTPEKVLMDLYKKS